HNYGLNITGGANTVVAGNYIGTDVTGSIALGNGLSGVLISNSSSNRIGTNGDGVADAAERNIISGNMLDGVRSETSNDNVIAGNYIGTDPSGTAVVPNHEFGVWLIGGARNRIGT